MLQKHSWRAPRNRQVSSSGNLRTEVLLALSKLTNLEPQCDRGSRERVVQLSSLMSESLGLDFLESEKVP